MYKTSMSSIFLNMSKLDYSDLIFFFDMDGTLVNTDYANFLSYKKAIDSVRGENFKIIFDPAVRFNRSLLNTIIPNLTEQEFRLIISKKEKYYDSFLSETEINYNIVEILCEFCKTNKTILVTNCRKERALATLNYHKLIDKFSDLFFREFGKKEKINKFQNAIMKLGISPYVVIAFENEENEIIDAITAGIQYINPKIQRNE